MSGPKTAIRSRWWPPTLWIARARRTAQMTAPATAIPISARLRLGDGPDSATPQRTPAGARCHPSPDRGRGLGGRRRQSAAPHEREEDERGEQQPLQADGQERRVGLAVVGAREQRRGRAGCGASRAASCDRRAPSRRPRRTCSPSPAPGGPRPRTRASSSPALAKPCTTPGATSTTSPGSATTVRRPTRKRIRPVDDLEALGLDRVDVRDRHRAAGAQPELEAQQLAVGRGGGLDEREALAGHGVLEGLSGGEHVAVLWVGGCCGAQYPPCSVD